MSQARFPERAPSGAAVLVSCWPWAVGLLLLLWLLLLLFLLLLVVAALVAVAAAFGGASGEFLLLALGL